MNKFNVVVTGSSGFVGQNLIPYLAYSEIRCISLSLRNNWELETLRQYEAIIHLSGKAHDTKNTSDPHEYFQINTALTIRLFDLFLKSSTRDFIYFSSVKAVADTAPDILMEDAIPNPKTSYGQSKQKAEEYLLSKALPEGKRLFILRPCMIHGPGNKGNLNLLYNVVKKGIPYPLGSFENKRSFLSIDNLLFVLRNIIEDKTIPGGIYNVADDEAISTNALIKIIAKASSSSGRIWYVSKGLISGMAKLGDKLRLPLNSERLKKLTESYVVSNEKIKKALNIDTLPMTAEQGLEKTIKSFQNK